MSIYITKLKECGVCAGRQKRQRFRYK